MPYPEAGLSLGLMRLRRGWRGAVDEARHLCILGAWGLWVY